MFVVIAGFLIFFALIALMWILRGLLSPILVGFLLAYVFDPVVDWTNRHWHWPRIVLVTLMLVILALIIIGLAVWLVPLAVEQIVQFVQNLPEYTEKILNTIGRGSTLDGGIREQIDAVAKNPGKLISMLLGAIGKSLGIFASTFGALTYIGVYILLVVLFFWAFSVHLPDIRNWFKQFLPPSHKDEILTTVCKISDAAGIFLRTRLLVALLLSICFTTGWAIAGVPFWFIFGVTAGFFNIIPFASGLVWLLVLLVNSLGADNMSVLFYALLWPTVVFAFVQFLDGWVFSPLLQGGKLKLHPVVVLFAVMAAGAVAGLLGMLVAIPLTAAWQITFRDVIKPRLAGWAQKS